jgi:hypothetical protein
MVENVPNQEIRPKQDLYISDWPITAQWQRRRTETDQSWLAFLTYLSLHPSQRSIQRAFEVAGGPQGQGPNLIVGNWTRWANIHKWNQRAVTYDRWKNERDILNEETRRAGETQKWEMVRTKERDTQLEMGRALMEKARAMLQFPLAQVERVTQTYEDGRARDVQIFKPGNWRFSDIARLVDVGAKLVRLSAEMETDRKLIDLRVIRAEAEQLADRYGLDTDDLLAMADQIAEEHWGQTTGKYDTLDTVDE